MEKTTKQSTTPAPVPTDRNLGLVRTEPCRYFDANADGRRKS